MPCRSVFQEQCLGRPFWSSRTSSHGFARFSGAPLNSVALPVVSTEAICPSTPYSMRTPIPCFRRRLQNAICSRIPAPAYRSAKGWPGPRMPALGCAINGFADGRNYAIDCRCAQRCKPIIERLVSAWGYEGRDRCGSFPNHRVKITAEEIHLGDCNLLTEDSSRHLAEQA